MITLPSSIVAYFAAHDSQAVADCFSENAVVYDENREHHGREAIKQWHAQSAEAVQVVNTPLSSQINGENIRVSAEVRGNFPGSPIVLQFDFILENQLIKQLSIHG